jgi:hypothetical protein
MKHKPIFFQRSRKMKGSNKIQDQRSEKKLFTLSNQKFKWDQGMNIFKSQPSTQSTSENKAKMDRPFDPCRTTEDSPLFI